MSKKPVLSINLMTFEPVKQPMSFTFYKDSLPKFVPLNTDDIPLEYLPNGKENDKKKDLTLYTDFAFHEDGEVNLEVDLTQSRNFARHYYRHVLFKQLEAAGYVLRDNFIGDIEVWRKSTTASESDVYHFYDVFGLRIQMMRMTGFPELVFYYVGRSRILLADMLTLDDNVTSSVTRVRYGEKIYHRKWLPSEAHDNLGKVFPVINNKMRELYGSLPTKPKENTYLKIKTQLDTFRTEVLFSEAIKAAFSFHGDDLITIDNNKVFKVNYGSNQIVLGLNERHTVYSPKKSLREFGPYKIPDKPVKFIMIYFEKDKNLANELYLALSGRIKNAEGKHDFNPNVESIYRFVRLNFALDIKNSLSIKTDEEPIEALNRFVDNVDMDVETNHYIAIYLSETSKEEAEAHQDLFYYRMKEKLLNHHVSTQVIYKDSVRNTFFKRYFMINIASAILAKAGGIPWQLHSQPKKDLVVGIGAFKSEKIGVNYIGSAISFNNDGSFREFDCMSENETSLLAQKIKLMVRDFVEHYGEPERLVIHFYKNMSYKELKPIQEALHNLGYPVMPVVILKINKTASTDYIAFDTSWPGLMPESGTIVQIAENTYLLFNNTFYTYNTGTAQVESWNLPLKIGFQSTHPKTLKDKAVISELLNQVYQFSRIYYKSVKQQNLPVTISYPEMVAKIFPWFEGEALSEFAKNNLWFL